MADPIEGGGGTASTAPAVAQNQPPSPSPTPAPSPAPSPARGIAAMVSGLSGEPEPKPEPTPTPTPEPKTPPAPTGAAPEPEPAGEGLWKTAPKHLKNDHYKTKRELEGKISEFERKTKELEAKSTQSPADLAKIKSYEERVAALEKDLAERESRLVQADYAKSDEFKRLYIDKGTKAYTKAISEIKGLKVTATNQETGEESTRPATQADFDAIRKLEPYDQDRKIHEMFGTSASRVALHLNILNSIESEANEAIASANEKATASQREQENNRLKGTQEFEAHSKAAQEELLKTHAAYFAPDETNPEATKALQGGYDYVDNAAKNAKTMTPKEYAETTTIIRGLASAAPRLMVEKRQLTAKVTALEAELAKYRKSAPGAASPGTAPAPAPKEARGIAAAIAASTQAA